MLNCMEIASLKNLLLLNYYKLTWLAESKQHSRLFVNFQVS